MIDIIILDIDGTLTDGKLYFTNSGEEIKAFNVKDGLGITQAIKLGKKFIAITGRKSKIVENRCLELGFSDIYQGVKDKSSLLETILKNYNTTLEKIAYMGDDINDLSIMNKCGLKGAPLNSSEDILKISDFTSTKNGGDGAVREFIEFILKKEGTWQKIIENFISTNQ